MSGNVLNRSICMNQMDFGYMQTVLVVSKSFGVSRPKSVALTSPRQGDVRDLLLPLFDTSMTSFLPINESITIFLMSHVLTEFFPEISSESIPMKTVFRALRIST